MALTKFSGFSGKSIDILDFHDSENKELTPIRNHIFQLYLVCSPDFSS